jgi:hypothetical protein
LVVYVVVGEDHWTSQRAYPVPVLDSEPSNDRNGNLQRLVQRLYVHEKWSIEQIAESSALDEETVREFLSKGRTSTIAWNEAVDVLVDLDTAPTILVGMHHINEKEKDGKDGDTSIPVRLQEGTVNGHSATNRESSPRTPLRRAITRPEVDEGDEESEPRKPTAQTVSPDSMRVLMAERLSDLDEGANVKPVRTTKATKKVNVIGSIVSRFRRSRKEDEKEKASVPSASSTTRGSGGRWLKKTRKNDAVPIQIDLDILRSNPDGIEYRLEVMAGTVPAVLHLEVLAKVVHS